MTTVVISQPMFLPWIGLFDQVRLADAFVHYDDVQRPQGRSMVSRVQVRTGVDTSWLTAPVSRAESGRLISETQLSNDPTWRGKHRAVLSHAYARCGHATEMLDLVDQVYAGNVCGLADFNIAAVELLSAALGLEATFLRSSDLGIAGQSTARLVAICRSLGATRYLTGHGAWHYIDHGAFEDAGIQIEYMSYDQVPWPQKFEPFSPFVTVLDPIAAVGASATRAHMRSETTPWRQFVPGG